MFLRINISEEGLLTLTCDSDYWSNAGAKVRGESGNGKKNTDSASPTVGTFQLRNYNKGTTASPNYNSHVKFMSKKPSSTPWPACSRTASCMYPAILQRWHEM